MDHTPLRLPRAKLDIYSGDQARLIPVQARAHDAQPNPYVDMSGIREVIEDAGPQPGRLKFGDVAIWIPIAIVGLIISSVTFSFLTSGLGPRNSPHSGFDPFALIPVFSCLFGLFFVGLGVWNVFTAIGSARRLRTAWRNGWIEYRPALIGELVYLRSKTEGSEKNERTHFYYSAPLLILQPDGSFSNATSGEFRANYPNALKSRGAALSEASCAATVDSTRNNGWTVAAYRTDSQVSEAEIPCGLSTKQIDAILRFAEQRWIT